MANASKKSLNLLLGLGAMTMAVIFSFIAFLVVTLIPLSKTHSSYYVFKEAVTEDESSFDGLDSEKSKIELFLVGNQYYTKTTIVSILGTDTVKTELSDFVISDGRIYFDISRKDFNELSLEAKNHLESYKISSTKLVKEDGEFVSESTEKMFLTGIIGLSISAILVIIVISMIITYILRMRELKREVSGKNLKSKIGLIIKAAVTGVFAVCFAIAGVLMSFGLYGSHSNTYVSYGFNKEIQGDKEVDPIVVTTGSWAFGFQFYKDGKKANPDYTATYYLNGNKIKLKVERVDNVTFIEDIDYVIKGNRIYIGYNEKLYDEFIKSIKDLPENEKNAEIENASYLIDLHGMYKNKTEKESALVANKIGSQEAGIIQVIGYVELFIGIALLAVAALIVYNILTYKKKLAKAAAIDATLATESDEEKAKRLEVEVQKEAEKKKKRIKTIISIAIVAIILIIILVRII